MPPIASSGAVQNPNPKPQNPETATNEADLSRQAAKLTREQSCTRREVMLLREQLVISHQAQEQQSEHHSPTHQASPAIADRTFSELAAERNARALLVEELRELCHSLFDAQSTLTELFFES